MKEEGKQTRRCPNGRQTYYVWQEYNLKEKAQKIEMTKNLEKIFRYLRCFGPDAWVGPSSVETHANFTPYR